MEREIVYFFNMRILLFLPAEKGSVYGTPDLGLGYLASSIRKYGHSPFILHGVNHRINQKKFKQFLLSFKPEVLGMKLFASSIFEGKEYLQVAKECLPGLITVIGGPYPTMMDGEKLMQQFMEADFAIKGEGEIPFPMLLEAITKGASDNQLSQIPGLIWRENSKVKHNEPVFFEDLDLFGEPAWDLMPPSEYTRFEAFSFFSNIFPSAPIIATRGCPYKCTYCGAYQISGRKIRKRSIENVIREIEKLKAEYGIKCFYFVDDNISHDGEYFKSLCRAIIEAKIDLPWNCPDGLRLNSLDEEMVKLMDQAGCVSINVGIESGSPRILKDMKKGITLNFIREKLNLIKRHSDIKVEGNFIIGYPLEDDTDINATIDFACELPLDTAAFSPFNLIAGTEIYQRMMEEGRLKEEPDWTGISYEKVMSGTIYLSANRVKKLVRKAFLKFYLRPKIIFNLLKSIKTFAMLKMLIRRIFRRFF